MLVKNWTAYTGTLHEDTCTQTEKQSIFMAGVVIKYQA